MDQNADSLHLVDPEILPALGMLTLPDLSVEALHSVRESIRVAFERISDSPTQPVVHTADDVPIYWFDPEPGKSGRPTMLYIHGGGMILGSAKTMQAIPAAIASTLRIPVASVDYRISPETPFPGPQEDCFSALRWLAANAKELGIDANRIAIIGESAGGGLAAATALMARDLDGPKIASQFLIYPMLDYRTGGEDCVSRNPFAGQFVWTKTNNQFGWSSLQGAYMPVDDKRGWFSPSLAESLAHLPRTWIGVGSLDLFFDESLEYARRLARDGVNVELHCYPGAVHGFNIVEDANVTQLFNRELFGAITTYLGSSS